MEHNKAIIVAYIVVVPCFIVGMGVILWNVFYKQNSA
jgi:hypothetical protein